MLTSGSAYCPPHLKKINGKRYFIGYLNYYYKMLKQVQKDPGKMFDYEEAFANKKRGVRKMQLSTVIYDRQYLADKFEQIHFQTEGCLI